MDAAKLRIKPIIRLLRKHYPHVRTALEYANPLQILVATILAAQSTDKLVNTVTPELFRKYPTAEAFARADRAELERLIHSTGFFRNKTKSIIGAAQRIVEAYGGVVPGSMEELVTLPGVARKTANIVLSAGYGKAEGIAVDTHAGRLSRRLGLSKEDDPVKVERDLMALVPKADWIDFNFLLVEHGRAICQARKPECPRCFLRRLCPSATKFYPKPQGDMIREAMLWDRAGDGAVACRLCAHRCVIKPGKLGVCAVRENRDGELVTLVYGEVVAAHVDPIEKKPLYHFFPGSKAMSIATQGCNFRCGFCQNWQISQAPRRTTGGIAGEPFEPQAIVRAAVAEGCRSISYTYTEPTIFFEYAYDTARLAREAGLANNFVTNGYMTAEALETIRPALDAANVDLKAFRDETYKKTCGARLEPVLDTIRRMKTLGVWVEVTTLVVPGMNDSPGELEAIARFIASVDPDIPWHISRFHPDYEYTQAPATPVPTLRAAAETGRREGLRYIYVGNVPGESEDTRCRTCGTVLVRRRGFTVVANVLVDSRCPSCGTTLPGRFS